VLDFEEVEEDVKGRLAQTELMEDMSCDYMHIARRKERQRR
jgi:hypothetical protein